jgi:hypothetical protein
VTVQALHRVKNILVITELIITTLFDRVLIVKYPMLKKLKFLTVNALGFFKIYRFQKLTVLAFQKVNAFKS